MILDAIHRIANHNQSLARAEAREHWQRYIELDPGSPWCDYARQRLSARK